MFGKKTFNDYELAALNVLGNYDAQLRIFAGDLRFLPPEPESIAALRDQLRKRGVLPEQSTTV